MHAREKRSKERYSYITLRNLTHFVWYFEAFQDCGLLVSYLVRRAELPQSFAVKVGGRSWEEKYGLGEEGRRPGKRVATVKPAIQCTSMQSRHCLYWW